MISGIVPEYNVGGYMTKSYVYRKGSLSRQGNLKNRADFWISHKERYDGQIDQADENEKLALLRWCSTAASRMWAYYCGDTQEEKENYRGTVREMHVFMKRHIPLFGYKEWGLQVRAGALFPHFYSGLSFRTAKVMNQEFKKLAGRE